MNNNKLLSIIAGKTDGGVANAIGGNICSSGEKIVFANWFYAAGATMADINRLGNTFGELITKKELCEK